MKPQVNLIKNVLRQNIIITFMLLLNAPLHASILMRTLIEIAHDQFKRKIKQKKQEVGIYEKKLDHLNSAIHETDSKLYDAKAARIAAQSLLSIATPEAMRIQREMSRDAISLVAGYISPQEALNGSKINRRLYVKTTDS